MKKIAIIFVVITLLIGGCTTQTEPNNSPTVTNEGETLTGEAPPNTTTEDCMENITVTNNTSCGGTGINMTTTEIQTKQPDEDLSATVSVREEGKNGFRVVYVTVESLRNVQAIELVDESKKLNSKLYMSVEEGDELFIIVNPGDTVTIRASSDSNYETMKHIRTYKTSNSD